MSTPKMRIVLLFLLQAIAISLALHRLYTDSTNDGLTLTGDKQRAHSASLHSPALYQRCAF
jgi:hypothetical protein